MPQRYLKFLFAIIVIGINQLCAQQSCTLSYYYLPENDSISPAKPFKVLNITDTAEVTALTAEVLNLLGSQSYLLASVSHIKVDSNSRQIWILKGPSISWIALNYNTDDMDVLRAAGWRLDLFTKKKYNATTYIKQVNVLLNYLEQNGFPFASVNLDSVWFDSLGIQAKLNLNKGELFNFDTVEVIGNANVKSWYIQKYLGIKKDSPYNESTASNMDKRIAALPFVQAMRPSLVYFVGNLAKPAVYLINKKSSSFDGVIGFAPASNVNNNKLLITGEANLKLQNLFATGKSLQINYKSYLNGTQDLKIGADIPYIFKSNIGFGYQLSLLKFDTTFLDVKNDFSFLYLLKGANYFRLIYSLQSTALITVDTNWIKQTKSLPPANDMKINFYGLGFKFNQYDYAINPRKGFGIDFYGGFGNKTIIKNSTINQIKFTNSDGTYQSIYDTINLNSVQYRISANADLFLPIATKFTIRNEVQLGYLQTNPIFINELFRFGGLSTLKGFDEQSIFANQYGIINTDLRYLLQQNSNVLVFFNAAWYENRFAKPTITDLPFGFGAGLNLETKAGVLSLYYAVGKEFDNPLEFNKAKIHFGLVSYF